VWRAVGTKERGVSYEEAKSIMWIGLALMFALIGGGAAYAMWRLGRVFHGAQKDMHRTVDEVVPLLAKAGVSMDQVNDQLGKVDIMMDSAVDMTQSLDTTVRTVSTAITEPVKLVSSTVAGAAEAARSLRERLMDENDAPDDVPPSTRGDSST
jgi:uncharacterized protein YoxC